MRIILPGPDAGDAPGKPRHRDREAALKKRALIILMTVLVSSTAFANIYVDFNGAYTQAGDLENQPGIGLTLAFSIHPNFNFFARTIYGTVTKDPNTVDEIEYSYMLMMGGLQSVMRIRETPFFWTASLGLGAAEGEASPANGFEYQENGFAFALWTGVLVQATQRISAYFEAGYHYPFYNEDLEDASVRGFQVLLGLRVTVWGKNRSLFGGY